jgi:hypothetical protein
MKTGGGGVDSHLATGRRQSRSEGILLRFPGTGYENSQCIDTYSMYIIHIVQLSRYIPPKNAADERRKPGFPPSKDHANWLAY